MKKRKLPYGIVVPSPVFVWLGHGEDHAPSCTCENCRCDRRREELTREIAALEQEKKRLTRALVRCRGAVRRRRASRRD